MSKTPLFVVAIFSLLCVISVFTSGCRKAKEERDIQSSSTESARPRRVVVQRIPSPAQEEKKSEHPPAQLLTTVKQTEPPPVEQGTPPLASMANMAREKQIPSAPFLAPTARRYGDETSVGEDKYINPLRTTEPPPPFRPLDSSLNTADQTATSPPVQTISTPSATPKTLKTKITDVPFDPIKENGAFFVDWPKPRLALLITGNIAGYIEPCGCAGLERMRGGMSRRYSLFNALREKDWPVVGLDAGGLAKGFGRQAEIKFQTLVEAMRKMGYQAIALGLSDLRLPAGELAAVAANFVSANVALFGFDYDMTSTYRIVDLGGKRVGVTAVLGKSYQKEISSEELEMRDPEEAIGKVLPEMKKQADFLVLLAHANMEETIALAQRFPDFDVVVTSGGPPVPPKEAKTIEGTKSLLIEVGEKGEDAIVLGLYDDPNQPYRYQRVPLDSRFAPSPDMNLLMTAYQEQLKSMGFAGLGLRPIPHPQTESNGKFTGSQKCEPCHEESFRVWKKSLHSQAYETLAKLDPPRNFDPECISCHVMGWHPTRYFPYQGGYESQEKTPRLIDVGCEACHGPGDKHVAAESGSNEKLMEKYRLAVRLTKADSEKYFCATCHDGDNSPDYNFEIYWPLVEHYETTIPETDGQQ